LRAELADHRREIRGESLRPGSGHAALADRKVASEAAESLAARLGGRERILRAFGDHLALTLGNHRHDPTTISLASGKSTATNFTPAFREHREKADRAC
jgi:hypothetical protein